MSGGRREAANDRAHCRFASAIWTAKQTVITPSIVTMKAYEITEAQTLQKQHDEESSAVSSTPCLWYLCLAQLFRIAKPGLMLWNCAQAAAYATPRPQGERVPYLPHRKRLG